LKKMWLVIAVTIVVSLLATACSSDKNMQDNIAAIVNGEPITKDDLRIWIDQREISLEIQKKMSQQNSENVIEIPEELRAGFNRFMMGMNVTPAELSEDQEAFLKSQYLSFSTVSGKQDFNADEYRYLKRAYSNFVFTPDESQALSHQIRNLVLYQEAVQQGYQVPEAEARAMYKATTMPPEGQEPESKEHVWYRDYLKIEKEVLQEHGYRSREAYLEQQFPSYVQSISITRLKKSFLEQWMVKYPNLQGFEYQVKSENAWYDHTESLIHQADIQNR